MLKGGFDGVKTFPVRGKVCDAVVPGNRRSSFPRQVEVAAPADLTGCVRRESLPPWWNVINEAKPARSLVGAELFETMTHATENRSSASDR